MTEDLTKPLTTWELMKAAADPDEMKELKEIDILNQMEKKQHYRNYISKINM